MVTFVPIFPFHVKYKDLIYLKSSRPSLAALLCSYHTPSSTGAPEWQGCRVTWGNPAILFHVTWGNQATTESLQPLVRKKTRLCKRWTDMVQEAGEVKNQGNDPHRPGHLWKHSDIAQWYVCVWCAVCCEYYKQVFSNGALRSSRGRETQVRVWDLSKIIFQFYFHLTVTLKEIDINTHWPIWMISFPIQCPGLHLWPQWLLVTVITNSTHDTLASTRGSDKGQCQILTESDSDFMTPWNNKPDSIVLYGYRLIRKGQRETWYITDAVTLSEGQMILMYS